MQEESFQAGCFCVDLLLLPCLPLQFNLVREKFLKTVVHSFQCLGPSVPVPLRASNGGVNADCCGLPKGSATLQKTKTKIFECLMQGYQEAFLLSWVSQDE